jgi:7-cyano-7-deazaguanine synthase
MTRKILIVLSGGQDSTTCAFWAKQEFPGAELHAVTFDYGQRHQRELDAAIKVAGLAGIRTHEIVSLGPVLKGTSPLVSGEKLEQYKDFHSLPGGLEKTFVPMRNTLFLTLAANRAVVLGSNDIVTGVCQEDFGGYPDCRQVFIDALEHAFNMSLEDGHIAIHTPLMDLTKAESVHLARELPGCYEALAYSHTSYDGAYPPKGHDHATLLRAKGFAEAGLPDPLVVRAFNEGLMDLPATENYSPRSLALSELPFGQRHL